MHSHAAANNSPNNQPTRDAAAMGASKACIGPHCFQTSGRVLQKRGINITMRQELMIMKSDGLHFWWISGRPAGSRTHIPGVSWNRVWNEQSD